MSIDGVRSRMATAVQSWGRWRVRPMAPRDTAKLGALIVLALLMAVGVMKVTGHLPAVDMEREIFRQTEHLPQNR